MEKLQSVLDSEKKKKDEDDANLLAEAFKALAEADKQGTYTTKVKNDLESSIADISTKINQLEGNLTRSASANNRLALLLLHAGIHAEVARALEMRTFLPHMSVETEKILSVLEGIQDTEVSEEHLGSYLSLQDDSARNLTKVCEWLETLL
ncbi:hypothetical protein BT96DRAFT_1007063 [Gymnopus androsaceus JB14]|uniref:Uncharacterized protein n=1 Tax=Gymnopus androsaceus JB14 TaxID=1447944 RepID=A0A6A4GJC7_9AGAR|nr:hypothetical protein BT96DRAFT_1007061 [Gymnopus androsaceus JB14]KAE9385414.1 hypothetical protein BT96DRAFT_1007063 [Gymnopus androsaceus JB14]